MKNVLIIFIKALIYGSVKTRLQPDVSQEQSLRLYRAMVEDLLERLKPSDLYKCVIFFSPAAAEPEIRAWLGEKLPVLAQAPGDLGRRMCQAFEWAFASGFQNVLLIGSDCPTIGQSDILLGFQNLAKNDVTLGPANDGGYYLIGLSSLQPRLFDEIDWSTDKVLRQTLERCKALNLSVELLLRKRDLDTIDDVLHLQSLAHSARKAEIGPRTLQALYDLDFE